MRIKTWQIITAIICIILGILLHFTYELSGKNMVIGLFSAVNESTWEHLKLLFFPMGLMAIIGSFVIKRKTYNYWFAQAVGILSAMIFTVVFFYTYTGIIGTNFAIVNIAIFIVAVCIGTYISYRLMISPRIYEVEGVSIFFLVILLLLFILYTFCPPQIQLFKDPNDSSFGIKGVEVLHIK